MKFDSANESVLPKFDRPDGRRVLRFDKPYGLEGCCGGCGAALRPGSEGSKGSEGCGGGCAAEFILAPRRPASPIGRAIKRKASYWAG